MSKNMHVFINSSKGLEKGRRVTQTLYTAFFVVVVVKQNEKKSMSRKIYRT